MATWILDLLRGGGYFALALLSFVESVFPPIPSELVIPLGGYLARQGKLDVIGVAAASALGSVLGALPLYYWGRKLGKERIKDWAGRHGRWVAVSPGELDRAQKWFEKHGKRSVFLGRLVPGIRSLVSIPAGIGKMPMGIFIASTAAGSLLWSGLLAGAGYLLGAGYKSVDRFLDPLSWAILGIILAMYLKRVIQGGPRKGR